MNFRNGKSKLRSLRCSDGDMMSLRQTTTGCHHTMSPQSSFVCLLHVCRRSSDVGWPGWRDDKHGVDCGVHLTVWRGSHLKVCWWKLFTYITPSRLDGPSFPHPPTHYQIQILCWHLHSTVHENINNNNDSGPSFHSVRSSLNHFPSGCVIEIKIIIRQIFTYSSLTKFPNSFYCCSCEWRIQKRDTDDDADTTDHHHPLRRNIYGYIGMRCWDWLGVNEWRDMFPRGKVFCTPSSVIQSYTEPK